ncbi:MAG: Rrf2 family transcriptional regulator [Acidimicrobiia bacterium]|nr:Rrf2 family transcriptional regulator [Acidimicrobiia bacterium]
MLRITAKLDYAVRAAIFIAGSDGSPVKAAQIAEREGLPVRFLTSTLSELRRAGILSSRRGGDGGFWLARPAREVSLADLIRAVEGDLVDVRALPQGSTAHLWSTTARTIERQLSVVTLADLVPSSGNPGVTP